MDSSSAPLIFISYSHKDRNVIDLLRDQLRVIALEGYVDLWDDTRIEVGDNWLPQIKSAIEHARVAILLISANFLNSKFIRVSEIPPLLHRRALGGLRVIPIVVDHCAWDRVDWLSAIQAITNFGDPVRGEATRKRHFAHLASQLAHQLDSRLRLPQPTLTTHSLLAVPPYSPGHDFFGRERELALLDQWLESTQPAMLFEAIGGMGKSMLTWFWVKHRAAEVRSGVAGIFWYSFYEAGANMDHFSAHALAYLTGKEPNDYLGKKAAVLGDLLISELQRRPWLFVLDGAERLLVEYNSFDAAQKPDEKVGTANQCIVPSDDGLLQKLCSEHGSKILITSRLTPRALLGRGGNPLPTVRRVYLRGLDPADAERMLRTDGIHGDSEKIRQFLQKQFECHPLVVGAVAGLVNDDPEAPGDFDRWAHHAELNLATMDLKARQHHILEAAFERLSPEGRALMARIAVVPDAVSWDEMLALNPYLPSPPEEVPPPEPPESDRLLEFLRKKRESTASESDREYYDRRIANQTTELEQQRAAYDAWRRDFDRWKRSPEVASAPRRLQELCKELRTRGLLQWEPGSARYDLHPVVRGFAMRWVSADEGREAGENVAHFFNSQEAPDYENVKSLGELRPILHTIRALLQIGNLERAFDVLRNGDLTKCLWFRLEEHREHLTVLKPFFPNGWDQPAPGLDLPVIQWLADDASRALYYCGQLREALPPGALALETGLQLDNLVSVQLGEYVRRLASVSRLREAGVLLNLKLELDAITDEHRTANLDLEASYALEVGDIPRAEDAFRKWEEAGPVGGILAGSASEFVRLKCRLRAVSGDMADADWVEKEILWSDSNDRFGLRRFRATWADWLFRQRRWADAHAKFAEIVAMERAVGLFDVEDECRLAACSARIGDSGPAKDFLAPPDSELSDLRKAELLIALGEREPARTYALRAYRQVWGEGAPFVDYRRLLDCRQVLKELGEPEPQLSPIDHAKADPVRFELELRAYIDKVRQQKADADAAKEAGDEAEP